MVKVILNESHSLMDEQEEILIQEYGNYDIVSVPSKGWELSEMKEIVKDLTGDTVVFASPIPYLIKETVKNNINVLVFHNDNREKKELPNGKIIMTVAKTGWQLV